MINFDHFKCKKNSVDLNFFWYKHLFNINPDVSRHPCIMQKYKFKGLKKKSTAPRTFFNLTYRYSYFLFYFFYMNIKIYKEACKNTNLHSPCMFRFHTVAELILHLLPIFDINFLEHLIYEHPRISTRAILIKIPYLTQL